MGYSDSESSIRVDFFKESGKWYTTEAVEWVGNGFGENAGLIHEQFRDSLRKHLNGRLRGMWAVALHPYHRHEFPLMMKVED